MLRKQLLPLNRWYQNQLTKAIDLESNKVLDQDLFTNLYEFYLMKRAEYRDDYIKNWTEEYRKYYNKSVE